MISKVEICGVNTANLPTLTKEEKALLLKKIKSGDKQARDKFTEGNLRLVLSVIKRFSGRGENPDDLFQVGCVGLIKAIDNFDINLGVQFSTYAVPMIIGEIRRFLRDNNTIRVSRSIRDNAYKILQVKEKITNEKGTEPGIEEIAKIMKMPPEEIVFALNAIAEPVSLFEPVYHDSDDTSYIMDSVKDSKNDDESLLTNIALKEAIESLPEREKNIVSLRFYRGKTQMEVAEEIGISQAQVSRLEKSALIHMKKYM